MIDKNHNIHISSRNGRKCHLDKFKAKRIYQFNWCLKLDLRNQNSVNISSGKQNQISHTDAGKSSGSEGTNIHISFDG
jgi:hypothetical protein